jgi:hypothetical protein
MTPNKDRFFKLMAICALVVSMAPRLAVADAIPTAHFDIAVSSGADSATWGLDVPLFPDPTDPSKLGWHLGAAQQMVSSTNPSLLLGTINTLDFTLDADPSVALNFAVTAGAANTNFTISSPVVGFAPITNGLAFATASLSVTDNNHDGGTLTGLFPGVKAYEAQYNGATMVFGDLVSPIAAAADASGVGQERKPAAGRLTIPGVVSDIQSQLMFTLTALDSGSGTSRFDIIVPEPSSIVLALAGCVALLWHVRRRR